MSAPRLTDADLDPLVDDLSLYVAGGRVHSSAAVIEGAVAAERLGLRRVWLSERYDLKEAGVLLGGMAALTSRLELGTAALIPSTRPPMLTAAMGATLHSAFGPRLTLGLGRSMTEFISNANLEAVSMQGLLDYAQLFGRLWRGETVDYDGPIGHYRGLHMADRYGGPAPQIYSVNLGGPKASKLAAQPAFSGVYLQPFMTLDAVRNAVGWIRDEAQRIGRDPGEIRIVVPIVSAPEMSESQERAYMHARMVTYLGQPGMADAYGRINGWDMAPAAAVRAHPMFRDDPDRVDHNFHREDLLDVARLVPDDWMYETSLSGTVEDCVAKMAAYRAAGADEISFYGSTPEENATLIGAWRRYRERQETKEAP